MKRTAIILTVALALLTGIAITPRAARADGIIIPEPPPPGVVTDPNWLTIKYHRVHVEIDNQIATTHVDQVFLNEGNQTAEGTYIFPLPEGAVVSDFAMWVDGDRIEANILERDEARRIYDDIVRRLRDPALLEYVGRQMVQANVFPIAPGDERRIELEYTQVLEVDQGLVSYVYPLNTEKFSARPLEEVVISVEVTSNDDIAAIHSDTHDIAIDREDERHFKAGYEAYDILPDTDFALRYSLASDEVNVNLLTYRESASGRGFFALLVAPPFRVETERVIPRDVILVLDQSGSMDGEKWEQARNAAAYVLENLNPEDRFNVVLFSTGWRNYANEMQPPGEADRAIDWIMDQEAIGGTDINGALLEAMDYVGERPAVVLFLTDGLATEGDTVETDEILENVADAAPSNVRLFTFGVGYDVDTVLLDSMAQDLGGTSAYVRPGERIDTEVSSLYAKISAPVLSDVELDFDGVFVEEVYPYPLPDLFAGTQLVIVGRYRDGGEANLTLSGVVDNDEKSFTYVNLEFPENAGGESFIPRLWATRRIGDLLNQIRLHGEDQELVDSIVQLSVRYGIITPYTSFLITEDDIFTDRGRGEAARDLGGAWDFEASGEGAVDAAEESMALSDAHAPAAMPTMAPLPDTGGGMGSGGTDADKNSMGDGNYIETRDVMRVVDVKTFALRDGVWIDTTYDPTLYPETEQVEFFSDAYFDLITEYPDLAPYFAVGERVIVVYEGVAYEVVPEGTAYQLAPVAGRHGWRM